VFRISSCDVRKKSITTLLPLCYIIVLVCISSSDLSHSVFHINDPSVFAIIHRRSSTGTCLLLKFTTALSSVDTSSYIHYIRTNQKWINVSSSWFELMISSIFYIMCREFHEKHRMISSNVLDLEKKTTIHILYYTHSIIYL